MDELGMPKEHQDILVRYLKLLDLKDKETRDHSARVALLAKDIAEHVGLDPRIAFTAGYFHDLGKAGISDETLKRKTGWSDFDRKEMDKHTIFSYELVKHLSSILAEIIVRHHSFQERKSPEKLPAYLHDYDDDVKRKIDQAGRVLALADFYDAAHRMNDRSGGMGANVGEEIKKKMLRMNKDQEALIEELYEKGVFKTETFGSKARSN